MDRPRDLATALMLGVAAGIVASAAATALQTAWKRAKLPPVDKPTPPPPTVVLADRISLWVTGGPVADRWKVVAGGVVHYAMGSALGAAYVLLARRWPRATAGAGAVYGIGVWAMVEEIGLAVIGLKPPPGKVGPAEHVFAASVHQAFALTLNAVLNISPGRSALGAVRNPVKTKKVEFRS